MHATANDIVNLLINNANDIDLSYDINLNERSISCDIEGIVFTVIYNTIHDKSYIRIVSRENDKPQHDSFLCNSSNFIKLEESYHRSKKSIEKLNDRYNHIKESFRLIEINKKYQESFEDCI